MTYEIIFSDKAFRQLKKLEKKIDKFEFVISTLKTIKYN